ncbi:MAG: phosphatase PAP2 family protein [Bacteroidaceae bacterium]|nr:phosphatase PAP2 family protein [Bacteroidaceae bacterium]
MKKTSRLLLASLLMLFSFQWSFSQFPQRGYTVNLYVERENQPDGGIFLPAPPDTCDVEYIDDFVQWQWGKTVRPTERGERASIESQSSTTEMARIYSEALGFTISRSETPAIYNLMSRSYHTAEQTSKNPKEKYMRIRPVIRFNEIPTGRADRLESLRTSGSYPSGHTTRGMATALVLAEMVPEYQDTILRRGFEYGESRIIVSAHYQSDVTAGYMCASAIVAAMHSTSDFRADMEAARAEYYEKSGRKPEAVNALPDGRRILSQPVDTASCRYYGDVAQYMEAKGKRSTGRGEQAKADADCSLESLLSSFSEPLGLKMSSKSTPKIAALLTESRNALQANASNLAAASPFRKRPYVQLGEIPFAGNDDRVISSYPSAESEIGWGIGLVLTEIAPDHANEILSLGFRIGESGIISGQHWATDIIAARIMAAAALAHLNSDDSFKKLLDEARKEYDTLKR